MISDQSFNTALNWLTVIEATIKIAQMQPNAGGCIIGHKAPQCDEMHRTEFGTSAS